MNRRIEKLQIKVELRVCEVLDPICNFSCSFFSTLGEKNVDATDLRYSVALSLRGPRGHILDLREETNLGENEERERERDNFAIEAECFSRRLNPQEFPVSGWSSSSSPRRE